MDEPDRSSTASFSDFRIFILMLSFSLLFILPSVQVIHPYGFLYCKPLRLAFPDHNITEHLILHTQSNHSHLLLLTSASFNHYKSTCAYDYLMNKLLTYLLSSLGPPVPPFSQPISCFI